MNRPASHNVKVAGTLAWEFWAHGWLVMLLAQLGTLAVPGFVFALMKSRSDFPPMHGTEFGALMYFCFYWLAVFFLGGALLPAWANPKARYTLPVSSWLLVTVPMACGVATILVQYSLVALVESALFGAGWPIWGPALLAATLLAGWHAILWSTSNSTASRVVALLAAGLVLAYGVARAAPTQRFVASGFLFGISARQCFVLIIAMLAAGALGSAGFAWLRHGSGVDFQRVVDWLRAEFRRLHASRARPFASGRSAQCWLEWSERGFALPLAGVLIGIPLLLLASCVPAADSLGDVVAMAGAWSMFFVLPLLVIGLIWGSRSRTLEFGHFGGSRPLSDRQIAAAILKSGTLSLILFGLIWALYITLCVLIFGRRLPIDLLSLVFREFGPFARFSPWCLAALGLWSVMGLITSLALAGRRVMIVALALVFCAYLGGGILAICFPMPWQTRPLVIYSTAWIVLCLLGALATFVTCWRRELIRWPALLLAAAILSIAVLAAHACQLTADWRVAFYVLACCGLLPIPLAAAPLAVYVNRHV